jgi:hypothetical protein
VKKPGSPPNLNTKTPVNKTNSNIYIYKQNIKRLIVVSRQKTKLKASNEKGKKEFVE